MTFRKQLLNGRGCSNLDGSQCLIQLGGGDGLYFVGNYDERTLDLQKARIFVDDLTGHIYIDKHGLN